MQPQDPFDIELGIDVDPLAVDINPYGSSLAGSETDVAAVQSDQQPQRWWTTLAVATVSLAGFLFFSGLMLLVALLAVHGRLDLQLLRDPDSFQAVSESRLGLLLVIVIPQLALLVAPVAAGILSPIPTRRRLGLVRGHWPLWGWVAAAMATPLIGLASSLIVGMFVEESETLKTMTEIFRGHGRSGFLVPLALMIGLTPAICEELLFRGYIQTRLTRTAGPAMGIVIASMLFAAFHMDTVHIIAVFPLGLYLGFIAWRSGSLFPAILGHFVNNVTSVIAVVFAPAGETDVLALPIAMVSLSVIGTGIIGLVAVIALSVYYGRPPQYAA